MIRFIRDHHKLYRHDKEMDVQVMKPLVKFIVLLVPKTVQRKGDFLTVAWLSVGEKTTRSLEKPEHRKRRKFDRRLPRYMATGTVLLLLLLSGFSYAEPDPAKLLKDQWIEVKTPNFHIVSDAKEKLAKAFAEDLEEFRFFVLKFADVKIKSGVPPFKVFAIQKKSNFKLFGRRKDVAGFFFSSGGDNFSVSNISKYNIKKKHDSFPRQILFHEYVHFLMRNSFGERDYPVWYEEGLADFLSTMAIDGSTILYGLPSKGRLRGINMDRKIPIETLFKATEYPEKTRKRGEFYSYAWAVLHYLYSEPSMSDKIEQYIRLYNEGVGVDEAFQKSLELSYHEFGKRVKSYLRKDNFRYWKLRLQEPFQVEYQTVEKMTADRAAFSFGRLFLYHGGKKNHKTGIAMLEKIPPQSTEFLSAKVYLLNSQRHQQGENADQILNAVEALYADNKAHSELASLYGSLLIEKAQKMRSEGDKEWITQIKHARRKYRRAIANDGNCLTAWLGMGYIYREYPVLCNEKTGLSEAITVMEELTYREERPIHIYSLSLLYEQRQHYSLARELYQQLIGEDHKYAKKARQRLSEIEHLEDSTDDRTDNNT